MMEEREELEMHDCDECTDPDCDQDHGEDAEFDRFTVTDEEGVEHHFDVIAELESDGKLYWVVEEFYEEGQDVSLAGEEDGYIVFRVEYDDDENPYLYSVEDEEFEEVNKSWAELVKEISAEDDEEE
jgi:uncharacterized protein YrzB (UPF0473 family)